MPASISVPSVLHGERQRSHLRGTVTPVLWVPCDTARHLSPSNEGSLPKRFSYLVGTIGTLQEVWCRFFPLQTADLRTARRSAPRRGQHCQRAAGGAVAPSRLRGVPFFMKQMTGKTPIPADLMVRQFQNTQGGPLIGSVHSLDSHRRSLSPSQRCASASQIQSVNRRFRSGKSGSPLLQKPKRRRPGRGTRAGNFFG